jgi:hypothetical protein
VVTIYGRMRRVAAGELGEGDRLMYPHSAVEILLMGIMQDCQKKNGTKDCRTTHTHRDFAEAKMQSVIPRCKVSISLVRYPCYLATQTLSQYNKCDLADDQQKC